MIGRDESAVFPPFGVGSSHKTLSDLLFFFNNLGSETRVCCENWLICLRLNFVLSVRRIHLESTESFLLISRYFLTISYLFPLRKISVLLFFKITSNKNGFVKTYCLQFMKSF